VVELEETYEEEKSLMGVQNRCKAFGWLFHLLKNRLVAFLVIGFVSEVLMFSTWRGNVRLSVVVTFLKWLSICELSED